MAPTAWPIRIRSVSTASATLPVCRARSSSLPDSGSDDEVVRSSAFAMLHDKARSAGFVLPPWMAGARVEALTKNEASMSRLSDGGHAGLSRPSIASEALGLLPGEMQEHFPAVPGWRDK